MGPAWMCAATGSPAGAVSVQALFTQRRRACPGYGHGLGRWMMQIWSIDRASRLLEGAAVAGDGEAVLTLLHAAGRGCLGNATTAPDALWI